MEILGGAGEAVSDLKQLFSLAEKFGYAEWIEFDASIFCGLAYYTGIVFETDQVDVRIKAVNLVGKLFALPKQQVAQHYHDLFLEFLKRFSNKSVEVRVSALQCVKAFYMASPSGTESHEVISKL
uniref:Uncharacterized protein n=1 Tax=Quercus lobata TaxID=97700 RepID=A0A7N2N081_QUELO